MPVVFISFEEVFEVGNILSNIRMFRLGILRHPELHVL